MRKPLSRGLGFPGWGSETLLARRLGRSMLLGVGYRCRLMFGRREAVERPLDAGFNSDRGAATVGAGAGQVLMIAAMIMPTATRTIAAWAHLRSSDAVRLLARVLVTRVIFPSSLASRCMRSAT